MCSTSEVSAVSEVKMEEIDICVIDALGLKDEFDINNGEFTQQDWTFIAKHVKRIKEVMDRYRNGEIPVPDDPDWIENRLALLGLKRSLKFDEGGPSYMSIPREPNSRMANLPA